MKISVEELISFNITIRKTQERYIDIRRIFEIIFIVVSIFCLFPFILIIIIILAIENKGSIFFIQDRPGLGAYPFKMIKFRTIKANNISNFEFQAYKSNISPFSNFLRKHRLDEIPQFLNILKGEMSLIGPRPEPMELYLACKDNIDGYEFRTAIKPGITGWAQVNYMHTNEWNDSIEKLNYDLYYIKHISLKIDLIILWKTVSTVFFGKGAS